MCSLQYGLGLYIYMNLKYVYVNYLVLTWEFLGSFFHFCMMHTISFSQGIQADCTTSECSVINELDCFFLAETVRSLHEQHFKGYNKTIISS
jgi:hypothetical protein